MKCPKCGNENITIQLMQDVHQSKHSSVGFAGHAQNFGRGMLAVTTLGVSNLFIPKAKGKSKTKVKNEKIAICQSCGNSWKVS